MFVNRTFAGRIAVTTAEAQNLLECPLEIILAYIPEHWRERMGDNSIPVAAVEDLARMLRVPCNQ